MRSLMIIEHMSLDGVIEIGNSQDGSSRFPHGEWTAPYRRPEGIQRVLSIYGERFDLLLGRRTYDLWSGFWPTAPKGLMADRLNAATKHVVTHRPESLAWGPSQAVGPEVLESVRALKASDGPRLVVSGSSSLTSTLLGERLADELVLLIDPVLLGSGKRLFAEGSAACAYTLESSQALPSGIVLSRYRAPGPLLNKG